MQLEKTEFTREETAQMCNTRQKSKEDGGAGDRFVSSKNGFGAAEFEWARQGWTEGLTDLFSVEDFNCHTV